MQLLIDRRGQVTAVYGEMIDLRLLGDVSIRRASHVEPTNDGLWSADLSPVGGPVLGPFDRRTQALAAEVKWLDDHLVCLLAQ